MPTPAASSSSGSGSDSGSGSGSGSAAVQSSEGVEAAASDAEGADPPARKSLDEANDFKARGNTHFQAQEYEQALLCYTHAIDLCPLPADVSDGGSVGGVVGGGVDEGEGEASSSSAVSSPADVALREQLAVFHANRAACYAKSGEHSNVIDDCTRCLELRPGYVKALMRRALAREALEQPTEALDDVKHALQVEPSHREAKLCLPRLEAASAAKLEKQKEEMMGKLKDLGNSVLGHFGMSLDNFKADKDPNTGSYNISFQR